MGNSHCLRFLPVNVRRQEFVSWKNYEGSCSCSFVMPGHDHCCAFGCTGETIFVDNSLQKTQLLRSELILFIDILAGFTCCWAHPSESSTVFFFFLFFFCFFFNFSGHTLCSEHCSQLDHCVASVFSVYIIMLRFSSFFYLFIYLFPDKDVLRDSTSEK